MKKIAVIGQGYVGLPLSIAFSYHFPVVGFDIDEARIEALKEGYDKTLEVDSSILINRFSEGEATNFALGFRLTSDVKELADCQIFIVTVPTPIDVFKAPDLVPLMKATELVAGVLKRGDIVIYESTVYPGCTEEECVPVLERRSGLKFNEDFFVGYSPERVVPGDKLNTLATIKKVTSGSTAAIADEIDEIYRHIIDAGTFKASSIKVAEASKAIENAQRDVNISFVNELALIFDRVGIDTYDVLEAASTKFNFLNYKPGLVGGHCISVDPYYLTHKAVQLGYHPNVILSGRRVNDSMPEFVVSKVVKLMIKRDIPIRGAKVLLLGITFKENCPDIRNTKIVEVYKDFVDYGMQVDIYDPWADPEEVQRQYEIKLLTDLKAINKTYDAIVVAVAHQEFLSLDYMAFKSKNAIVFDLKACLDREQVDIRL